MTILEKIGRGIGAAICVLASLVLFFLVFFISVWTGADSTPSSTMLLYSGLMWTGGVLAGVSFLFGAQGIRTGRGWARLFRWMVIVHFGLVAFVFINLGFSMLYDNARFSDRATGGILVALALLYLLAAWGIFAWRRWGQIVGIILSCLMGLAGRAVSSESSPILELVPLYLVLVLDLGWYLSPEIKIKFASDGMRA